MLQTVLLIEVFGKLRAGMRQHDMANLFHELSINVNNSLSFIYHIGGGGGRDQFGLQKNTKTLIAYCSFFSSFILSRKIAY